MTSATADVATHDEGHAHPTDKLFVKTAVILAVITAVEVAWSYLPWGEGFGFTTAPGWSAFYALTGFHGVHVTLGIVMLLSCLALSLRGRLPQARAEAVEIVGLYWHFVDIVWVLIFTVVYLIK